MRLSLTLRHGTLFKEDHGSEWANDEIVDAAAQVLCRCAYAQRQALPSDHPSKFRPVFILRACTMLFLVTPHGLKARPDVERAALLRHPWFVALKEEVARRGTGDIYLPISVNNCHWIVGKLDVAKATWNFCDSSSNFPLSSTYYQACLFIAQGLGLNCPIQHSPPSNECFKSGRQSDGHSCAYFALNAIEHDIFDYALACPRTAKYIRLRTFLLVLQEGTSSNSDAPRRQKGYEQLD